MGSDSLNIFIKPVPSKYLLLISLCFSMRANAKVHLNWREFHEDKCVFHQGPFDPTRSSRMSHIHEEVIQDLTLHYLPYFKLPMESWSFQLSEWDSKKHNPKFKIRNGCIVFLLFEPTYDVIEYAVFNSGYKVNLEAYFFIFWTKGWYESVINYPGGWFGWDILFADARIYIIVDQIPKLGFFCYACENTDRIHLSSLDHSESIAVLKTEFDKLSRNIRKKYVAIGNIYYDKGTKCEHSSLGQLALYDTCLSLHFLIDMLRDSFNFSIQPSKYEYYSLFQHPLLGRDYQMIIFVGPLGRGRFLNDTKQYLMNTSISYLIYCVNTHERDNFFVTLLTPFAPFDRYTWICIGLLTISFLFLIRPDNHICYWTIMLRSIPHYNVRDISNSKCFTKKCLIVMVVFWCFISSNLVTNLYEGFLASQITVPFPPKIIPTVNELILKNMKIVLPGGENKIEEAYFKFLLRFTNPVLHPYRFQGPKQVFENLTTDKQVLDFVFQNPGKKSTYQYLEELGSSIEYLEVKTLQTKDSYIQCFVVPEVYGNDDNCWMFVFHMSCKFYEFMGWILQAGLFDHLESLRIHFRVQHKRNYRRDLPEKEKVSPLSMEANSKLIVVFFIHLLMSAISCAVFFGEYAGKKLMHMKLQNKNPKKNYKL